MQKGISSHVDLFSHQERTIERLKEQRDRDEREKQEEIDNYKKDLKDLKEKVSLLQGDLSEKEVKLTRMELVCLLNHCTCPYVVGVYIMHVQKYSMENFLNILLVGFL